MDSDAGSLGADAMRRLRARSVCQIDAGLTAAEFDRVEGEFGFAFADDHRAFLAAGLPVNRGLPPAEPGVIHAHPEPWPDWRNGEDAALRASLSWPTDSVLFDVEHNDFWYEAWGPRPADAESALDTAGAALARVPTMVPVYGHRYLPAGRGSSGHPVLSVWQTDIVYYGSDLADYIEHEFGSRSIAGTPRATVRFWRDLL